MFFFFFKQKTAYEMRISDWSSDVCSSDLSGKERTSFSRESMSSGEFTTDAIGPPRQRLAVDPTRRALPVRAYNRALRAAQAPSDTGMNILRRRLHHRTEAFCPWSKDKFMIPLCKANKIGRAHVRTPVH